MYVTIFYFSYGHTREGASSKGDQENGRVTSWSNEMSILLFLDYSEFRRDSGPDVMFLKVKKFIDFQENISHVLFYPIFRDNLYDQMSQSAPLWL